MHGLLARAAVHNKACFRYGFSSSASFFFNISLCFLFLSLRTVRVCTCTRAHIRRCTSVAYMPKLRGQDGRSPLAWSCREKEDVREACHCDVLGETKNTGTSISGGNVRWQHRDLRDYFTANVRFPLPPPSARGRRKKRVGWRDKGITARHCDMALWRHVMKQKRPMFQSGPRGFTTLTVWGDGGGDGGGGGGGQGVLRNIQTGEKKRAHYWT